MTFQEWEQTQPISPVSPEAYYAEEAWNAAVIEVRRLLCAASGAEKDVGGLVLLLDTELEAMLSD
ncbi:MAG: hypothetical protein KAX55_00145 [Propionivibrio sp.]|nr:hypothetical protein [Propionivibrio sp.]